MKKQLLMNPNPRFYNVFQFLRKVMNRGILGDIFEIRAAYCSANQKKILNPDAFGFFDVACQLLDAPIVSSIAQSGADGKHLQLFLKAKNGRMGSLTISTLCDLKIPTWMMLGTCGSLSITGTEATLQYYDPKKVKPIRVKSKMNERTYKSGDVLPWKVKTCSIPPTRIPKAQVTSKLVTGKRFKSKTTCISNVETVKFLEACFKKHP
jgi:predicted dehydrogenase